MNPAVFFKCRITGGREHCFFVIEMSCHLVEQISKGRHVDGTMGTGDESGQKFVGEGKQPAVFTVNDFVSAFVRCVPDEPYETVAIQKAAGIRYCSVDGYRSAVPAGIFGFVKGFVG